MIRSVVGIDADTKVRDLTEEEILRLREAIDREVEVEGARAKLNAANAVERRTHGRQGE